MRHVGYHEGAAAATENIARERRVICDWLWSICSQFAGSMTDRQRTQQRVGH